MVYLLIRLAKRPENAPLAPYQAEQLKRAQSAALPPGCTRLAHSQPVERAYRQSEPAFDILDEHQFDELAPAHDFLRQCVSAQTLLTCVLPVKTGPVPADGLKHVELLRRRLDIDRAAFNAYWREVHGPIAAAMATVLRYDQCHALEVEGEAHVLPFDGVALLRFASMQSLREGAQHPSFARAREDMPAFMDMAASDSVLTRELVSISR